MHKAKAVGLAIGVQDEKSTERRFWSNSYAGSVPNTDEQQIDEPRFDGLRASWSFAWLDFS